MYFGLCTSTPSSSESITTTDWSLGVVAAISFVWLRVARDNGLDCGGSGACGVLYAEEEDDGRDDSAWALTPIDDRLPWVSDE